MSSLFRIDRRYVSVTAANQLHNRQPGGDPAADEAASGGEQPFFTAQEMEHCAALRAEAEADAARTREEADAVLSAARTEAEALLEAARRERADLIAKTEVEVREALQKADHEAIEIHGQAWREGFEEGKSEAAAQIERERENDRESLRGLLEQVDRERTGLFDSFEEDMIRLSLAVAKKILNTALKNDDNMYESMVRHALDRMKREGKLLIRVDEHAYQRFFASGAATFTLPDGVVTATVIDDPALGEGDLVLESDMEILDAGVDTQLKSIALAFGCKPGEESDG